MASRSKRPQAISEKVFVGQIVQLARLCGWMVFHPFDSRRSEPGWPDLAMTRPSCGNQPGRLVLAEIKSDRGKLTREQAEWLRVLGQVPNVEVFCWRPCHWDEIVAVLRPDAGDVKPDRLASRSRHTTAHGETARHE